MVNCLGQFGWSLGGFGGTPLHAGAAFHVESRLPGQEDGLVGDSQVDPSLENHVELPHDIPDLIDWHVGLSHLVQ